MNVEAKRRSLSMGVITYKCPNCGAELTFDPEHQNFNCEYCDTSYTEAEMQQLYQNMEQQANQNRGCRWRRRWKAKTTTSV